MSEVMDRHERSHYVEQAKKDCLDRLGTEIVLARMLHSGRQNTIVHVRDTGGVDSCVRYRTAKEFWYEDTVKEPFIESLGIVDIPRVRCAADDVRPQLLICEFVAGDLLHDLAVDEGIARRVGRVMAAVHVPAHGAATYADFAAGMASERSWRAEFIGSLRDTALRCGYPAAGIDALIAVSDSAIAAAEARGLVLVHNDLHFKNIIRRPDGTLCLLDWDSAAIAPAEKDFVKLLDWSHHNGEAVEHIIDAYQESADRPLDWNLIELFRIYAILRQILFQSLSVAGGVQTSVLSQGGFFPETATQRAKLEDPLRRLGLRPWAVAQ